MFPLCLVFFYFCGPIHSIAFLNCFFLYGCNVGLPFLMLFVILVLSVLLRAVRVRVMVFMLSLSPLFFASFLLLAIFLALFILVNDKDEVYFTILNHFG